MPANTRDMELELQHREDLLGLNLVQEGLGVFKDPLDGISIFLTPENREAFSMAMSVARITISALAISAEVSSFSIPIAPWVSTLDGMSQLLGHLLQLLGGHVGVGRCPWDTR